MEATQQLKDSISRDCDLIFEALRRLKDGTWELHQEDLDWAEDLFPKIKQALSEHMSFERNCILPSQMVYEEKEQLKNNDRIMALIWAAEHSIRTKKADHFHALLDTLAIELNRIHKSSKVSYQIQDHCDEDCAKNRIIKRAVSAALER